MTIDFKADGLLPLFQATPNVEDLSIISTPDSKGDEFLFLLCNREKKLSRDEGDFAFPKLHSMYVVSYNISTDAIETFLRDIPSRLPYLLSADLQVGDGDAMKRYNFRR